MNNTSNYTQIKIKMQSDWLRWAQQYFWKCLGKTIQTRSINKINLLKNTFIPHIHFIYITSTQHK